MVLNTCLFRKNDQKRHTRESRKQNTFGIHYVLKYPNLLQYYAVCVGIVATATCTVAPSRRQYKWGTDQNIGEEIFTEYKYTLNELLVTKIAFQYV